MQANQLAKHMLPTYCNAITFSIDKTDICLQLPQKNGVGYNFNMGQI